MLTKIAQLRQFMDAKAATIPFSECFVLVLLANSTPDTVKCYVGPDLTTILDWFGGDANTQGDYLTGELAYEVTTKKFYQMTNPVTSTWVELGENLPEWMHTTAVDVNLSIERLNSFILIASKGEKGDPGDGGGAQGPKGDKGDKGDPGEAGQRGADGAAGAKGDPGVAGAASTVVGPQGPQGIQGPKGDKGDTGPASTVAGPAGETGPKGDKGDTGAIGPAGPESTVAGPAGAQGPQGIKGDKGDTGPIGPASTVAGPAGAQGVKGDKGDTGATGPASTVAGPQGPKGDTGAQGLQGSQGPAGAASTVPGPQGLQGAAGAAGAAGAKGDKGDTGAQGPAGVVDASTLSQLNTNIAARATIASIVDTLLSTATNAPLSANQGRVLKGLIDALAAVPYDIAGSIQGKPAASAVVMRFAPARPTKLPLNYAGSVARCVTAPTAATVFTIFDGATNIGTITFAVGALVGTFSNAAARTLPVTTQLTIVAPATADATFADAAITIAATL